MKAARAWMVTGASAVILTGGVLAAPEPIEDAGDPVAAPDDDTDEGGADDDTGEPAPAGATTVDGPVVTNLRGDYQVRLHIEAGQVVDVEFPMAGTSAAESRRVNAAALPVLEERIIEAQSGDVEYVSGASYTSPAMVESARTAFEEAGL